MNSANVKVSYTTAADVLAGCAVSSVPCEYCLCDFTTGIRGGPAPRFFVFQILILQADGTHLEEPPKLSPFQVRAD
jgi:hypothetical protein